MPIPLSKLCPDYESRIAVFRALAQPVAKMTVEEICANAGITRKRFYTLFNGKEDVFRWYLDLCFEASLYEIGSSLTWREGIEACLFYVKQESAAFMTSYRDRAEPPSRYWWLAKERSKQMRQTLEARGVGIDLALDIEIELFSQATPPFLRSWIEVADMMPIPEYADIWLDSVPRRLMAALDLP